MPKRSSRVPDHVPMAQAAVAAKHLRQAGLSLWRDVMTAAASFFLLTPNAPPRAALVPVRQRVRASSRRLTGL
jgi:hypothetical protein